MSYQSKYTGQEIDNKLDQIVNYEEKELLTSKAIYSLGGTTAITINRDLILNDDITKYDVLVFRTAKGNGQDYEYQLSENTILVSNIIYNNSDTNLYIGGSRFTINSISGGEVNCCGVWFKNSTTLKVYNTFSNKAVDNNNTFDFLSIKGIKLSGGSSSSENNTPVGNIISFMGTKAPKGYLICDGTEYNITDYPKLANHFAEQFENIAYFGGDGVNTFKVPDLRNEFLRGYGELSEDIGLHQDATQHTGIYVSNYGKTIYCPNYDYANIGNTNKATNTDSEITNADLGTDASKYQIAGQDGGYTSIVGSQYATSVAKYTSRPTNVAVLYCIKY